MPKTKTKPQTEAETVAAPLIPDDAILAFQVNIDSLTPALDLVGRAVPSRPTHPILANFRISADPDVDDANIKIQGFDLAIGITMFVEANVQKYGTITLPAKLFTDIVRKLPSGLLQVTVNADYAVTLLTDTGRFEIRGQTAGDYPNLHTIAEGDSLTLPVDEFRRSLQTVLPAISTDETKMVLTCANLAQKLTDLVIASTDGHRLHVTNVLTADDQEWTLDYPLNIPHKAVDELNRALAKTDDETFIMRWGNGVVEFECGSVELCCRLMEGQFPNYNQLIPRQFAVNWTCDRRLLLDTIERVRLFTTNNVVKFTVSPDEIVLSGDGPDIGSGTETVVGETTSTIEIAFNSVYVIEALKVLMSPSVTFFANTPTSPAVLQPMGASTPQMLIMPVQIRGV